MNRFHLYTPDIFTNKIRSHLLYTFLIMCYYYYSSHFHSNTINQTYHHFSVWLYWACLTTYESCWSMLAIKHPLCHFYMNFYDQIPEYDNVFKSLTKTWSVVTELPQKKQWQFLRNQRLCHFIKHPRSNGCITLDREEKAHHSSDEGLQCQE
jgi:hypothetical protein